MAKFISRCRNQVLCIKPNRPQIIDGIVVPVPGQHIRFENGSFETTNKDEMSFIKSHRLFGSAIFEDKKQAAGDDQTQQ